MLFNETEQGRKIDRATFQRRAPELRTELLQAHFELREREFPVVVVVSGDDRTSCHEVLNRLHEWLDARYLEGHAYGEPTEEERSRPLFWRYWRSLPRQGRIGLFMRGWTMQAVVMRLIGDLDDPGFDDALERVCRFERMIVDDGALLLKFWLHLSREELKKRARAAERNPEKFWREGARDRRLQRQYKTARGLMERTLRTTSTGLCPWKIVESADARYRDLKVAEALLHGMRDALERRPLRRSHATPQTGGDRPAGPLASIDLSLSLAKGEYEAALARWQRKLFRLTRLARERDIASVLVFEGSDAAGKGGAIRRLIAAMDASLYRVVPIAAPSDEELAHHYLWRFWRRVPPAGRTTIFDRSWYGRVLVERVEGLARPEEWKRAYDEINEFEYQLTSHGMLVLKFWLQIDPDEQLRRFRQRHKIPYKRFKLTDEDFRNRRRWREYEVAADEMIERTNHKNASWHLIPANDKRFARVAVIEAVCRALRRATRA